MCRNKEIPKERYIRQRRNREIRRILASITPSNSHPQNQSTLFSILPSEIRFLISKHVLSQQSDHSQPINIHSISPLFRPGHTFHTTISTTLLQTCRLVYSEAHAIALRSATHHFRHLGSTSLLYTGDLYLRYMSSQTGANLYHLYDNLIALNVSNFKRFFLPHPRWKRITWTICTYLWPSALQAQNRGEKLRLVLGMLMLPESCREATLELETREDLMEHWDALLHQANGCRKISLSKSGGDKLIFDDRLACQYTWTGSGLARWGSSVEGQEVERMEYHTIRLVWRSGMVRREYVSYDSLSCLRLHGLKEVKTIEPFCDG